MANRGSQVSARGLLRALARTAAVLVLAVLVYLGLAKAGVIQSPFNPVTRGDLELARSETPGMRVLFVGNSFTSTNSMPHMLHELAAEDPGAEPVFAVERTRGGWTLEEASGDGELHDLLREVHWDAVVLQEQSQALSFSPDQRRGLTYPFAQALATDISASGGRPVLFMTWGYLEGDRRNVPDDTYAAMQARLDEGYEELGAEIAVPVAPVGRAWTAVLEQSPSFQLWSDDGKHPSTAGSYLAACVFYRMLTGASAEGSRFTAGLDPADAHLLQRTADEVVSAEGAALSLEGS